MEQSTLTFAHQKATVAYPVAHARQERLFDRGEFGIGHVGPQRGERVLVGIAG